jgi:hypothetical protein
MYPHARGWMAVIPIISWQRRSKFGTATNDGKVENHSTLDMMLAHLRSLEPIMCRLLVRSFALNTTSIPLVLYASAFLLTLVCSPAWKTEEIIVSNYTSHNATALCN